MEPNGVKGCEHKDQPYSEGLLEKSELLVIYILGVTEWQVAG